MLLWCWSSTFSSVIRHHLIRGWGTCPQQTEESTLDWQTMVAPGLAAKFLPLFKVEYRGLHALG